MSGAEVLHGLIAGWNRCAESSSSSMMGVRTRYKRWLHQPAALLSIQAGISNRGLCKSRKEIYHHLQIFLNVDNDSFHF